MTESGVAAVNGVELAYEVLGAAHGEPLLLIMGLGSPMHEATSAVRFFQRHLG